MPQTNLHGGYEMTGEEETSFRGTDFLQGGSMCSKYNYSFS